MRIVEVQEKTASIASPIANAFTDFSRMTCSAVAAVTDVVALMLMEDGHLVEKHAQKLGLPQVEVTWAKLGGPQAMNDVLLFGNLDLATGGVPSLITLWSKTKGTSSSVKGVGALNDMPNELIVGRPELKSIRDLGPQDKIAVTSVKISTHPDAMSALLSRSGGITGPFASPPFSYQELARPPLHSIANSYDILGGPATFNVVWSTSQFHDANPKAYAAFVAAFEDATDAIRIGRTAEFLHRTGRVKNNVHGREGGS